MTTTTTFGALPVGATFDDPAWGLLGRGMTKVSETSALGYEGSVGTVPPERVVLTPAAACPEAGQCDHPPHERI